MFYVPTRSGGQKNTRARRWLRPKEERREDGERREQYPSIWALEHSLTGPYGTTSDGEDAGDGAPRPGKKRRRS